MSVVDGWRGEVRTQARAMDKIHDHLNQRQVAKDQNLDTTAISSTIRSELRLVRNAVTRMEQDLGMMRTNPSEYRLSHENVKECETDLQRLQRQIESASRIVANPDSAQAQSGAREQLFGGHHPQEQQQSGYGEQSSGGFHNAQAILKDQDKIMDEQDEQLAHLQKSVRTLLNVSREINEELEHQEGIIDELGNEVKPIGGWVEALVADWEDK
eukprot:TRINITY_DN1149_c0_g1_i14.p1 TRINITY_DN1149_c0_g1~~TRINITY_DN1149_c0_g1_i14.p1  ORF type:complete len:213 (-),score=44.11 TRINITY_DN1149_c0_g1_i14:420-1058(-)